jgi:hypothetical protein
LRRIKMREQCPGEFAVPTKKETNPKQVYGDTKVGLSSLPFGPIYEVALAMTEGGMKYGKHNYREMGCKASTYFDAAIGHLVSWWEGNDIDEESGLPHLIKAAACLIVYRDSELMDNNTDDRPIRYGHDVSLRKNPLLQGLLEKFPNPVEPYTEKRRLKNLLPKKPGYGGHLTRIGILPQIHSEIAIERRSGEDRRKVQREPQQKWRRGLRDRRRGRWVANGIRRSK